MRFSGKQVNSNSKPTHISATLRSGESLLLLRSDRLLAILVLATLLLGASWGTPAHAGLIYYGGVPSFNNCYANNAPSAQAALDQVRICTGSQIDQRENPIWVVSGDDHVAGGLWYWSVTTTYAPCCGGGGTNGPNHGSIAPGPSVSGKDVGLICPNCGDPITLAIGNKTVREPDFVAPGANSLRFVRTYNSSPVGASAPSFAQAWMHNYGTAINSLTSTSVVVSRADGKSFTFNLVGAQWTSDADVTDTLIQLKSGSTVVGWQYFNASDDSLETYDSYGNLSSIAYREGTSVTLAYLSGSSAPTFPAQLLSVKDSFGRALTFNSASNTPTSTRTMTDPNGGTYSYTLGSLGQVTSVAFPDSTAKSYLYNEAAYTGNQSYPYAITGVVDENNSRYDSTWYGNLGIAVQTALAGSVGQYSLTNALDSNNRIQSTSATNPLGSVSGAAFGTVVGRNKVSSSSQPAASGQPAGTRSFAYDTNGNTSSSTDLNGNLTCSAYDLSRNLETGRVEGMAPGSSCPSNIATYAPGAGTVERKIQTQWHSVWHLPAKRAQPLKITTWVYNGDGGSYCAPTTAKVGNNPIGVVCSRTEQGTTDATGASGFSATSSGAARVWTYTYNAYGQALTAKSPRTDLNDTTTYAYNSCSTGGQCGQIQTIKDSVGHTTTFNTYDGNGNPKTITDPNGTVTTIVYDARQRVTSIQVGTETTGYSYYPTGQLHVVTQPDGSTATNTYDAAHRLTQVTDGLGNYVKYTLDNAGNVTATNFYNSSNALQKTHSQPYNTLGMLYQDISAAGTAAVTTTYAYDAQGNQTSLAAPLSRNTANAFDPLNRLHQINDPASGITTISYDGNDNVVAVKDPNGFTTSYAVDGFGQGTRTGSPDSGTTNTVYIPGREGDLVRAVTDNRGQAGTYTFDAASRLTSLVYADQTLTYLYDQNSNGIGHLTGAHDAAHTMSWSYDALGRVIGKSIGNYTITKSVAYAYTNGDRTSLTTPSGQAVVYGYANHRINTISINGTTLLSGVVYEAFGPAKSWNWGDGIAETHNYNTDGNVSSIVNSETITLSYDNALRVHTNADNYGSGYTWTVGYDNLDRVISDAKTGSTYGFTYDANGNALTQTGTFSNTFGIASTNNQINSSTGSLARTYSYNGKGDVAGYGNNTYTYNDRGRISSAVVSGVTSNYWYDALGAMFQKRVNGTMTFLVYDEDQHLIGEYASNGSLIQETIWMDDLPVATIRPNGSAVTVYYVQSDQLGTPRTVSRTTDHKPMWRWDPDPYGAVAPNQSPYGFGTFVYNLRYPGQYYQAETGLYYNYFRDYDPQTGRYLESDPIGLRGGINTYPYARGNPVNLSDPFGLYPAIQVTLPNGTTYIPMTAVKNSAQAAAFDLPEGTPIAIAVPPGADPQGDVHCWAQAHNKGISAFKQYWADPAHNYKVVNGPMFDAYGNFEYGATGEAAAFTIAVLQAAAAYLHPGWVNNPINITDIRSGYDAIYGGGKLSVIDYVPTATHR